MSFSKWNQFKFSDFVSINPTISLKGGNTYSFIEMKDLSEGKRYVQPSADKKLTGGARFREGNTLFARITPCLENGKIGQAKKLKDGVGFGSTEFLVFEEKQNVSNKDFIYYLACWQEVRKFAEQNMIGTSGRQRVGKDAFEKLELKFPDLISQQKIASILSSLDDKIELNNKTNQTLEAMAQSLFKEMCLPKEEDLPKGWKVLPLDEVAEFLNGLALQKFPATDENDYLPVIKIREIKNGITNSTDKASRKVPSKYIIQNGDLLFSWSATLEVMFWCFGEGALNQHLFKVTSNKFPLWFCYMLIDYHIKEFRKIASDKTTTMGHIQRKHLTEALCFIPNNFDKIDKIISPIIEQIKINNYETQNLTSIRQSILPKLMAGEIKI